MAFGALPVCFFVFSTLLIRFRAIFFLTHGLVWPVLFPSSACYLGVFYILVVSPLDL